MIDFDALSNLLDKFNKKYRHKVRSAMKTAANVITRPSFSNGVKFHNVYTFQCVGPDGNVRWTEAVNNLVTSAGLNDLLTQYFKGSSYTAAFSAGLIDNSGFSSIAAGDTAASHSGWTESTAYSNSTRPTITLGSASGGSIDNSGSVATFTINATATINGAFVSTSSTKGGTTGTLYGAASFGTARSVLSGDTINLTCSFSATSAY